MQDFIQIQARKLPALAGGVITGYKRRATMEQKIRRFMKWFLKPAVIFVVGGSFWIAYYVIWGLMDIPHDGTTDTGVAIVCWGMAIWIVCGVWRGQK